MVRIKDMIVGKYYIVDGVSKKLTEKKVSGNGGSGSQEPQYTLTFKGENDISPTTITLDWQNAYDEATNGGKRRSRLNRKIRRKTRKNRRKSKRCR